MARTRTIPSCPVNVIVLSDKVAGPLTNKNAMGWPEEAVAVKWKGVAEMDLSGMAAKFTVCELIGLFTLNDCSTMGASL